MQPKLKRDSRFMSNFVSVFGERFHIYSYSNSYDISRLVTLSIIHVGSWGMEF